ncbi:hypothetical protein [Sphingomonas sp. Ag1]|uniref:hypothetical protein n=1 Tax=Sphingomonas sp. Ag1 TaxID=1642949 RepID=UPI0012E04CDC|nr:hypothetical protein [Sphingomonas sp. Ag1]
MSLLPAMLLLAATPDPAATFYNRPGATPAMVDAELRRCRMITTGPHADAVGGDVAAAALTPAIPLQKQAAPRPENPAPLPWEAVATPTIEDCMVLRGWRLYALDAPTKAALDRLSPAARAARMAALIAARHPANATLLRAPTTRLRQP